MVREVRKHARVVVLVAHLGCGSDAVPHDTAESTSEGATSVGPTSEDATDVSTTDASTTEAIAETLGSSDPSGSTTSMTSSTTAQDDSTTSDGTTSDGTTTTGSEEACYEEAWTAVLSQIDDAVAVGVDEGGAIFVSGATPGATTTDAWVGALDADGTLVWELAIDPAVLGVTDVDEAVAAMHLDPTGALVLALNRSEYGSGRGLAYVDPSVPSVDELAVYDDDPVTGLENGTVETDVEFRRMAVGSDGTIVANGYYVVHSPTPIYGSWIGRLDPGGDWHYSGQTSWFMAGLLVDDGLVYSGAADSFGDCANESVISVYTVDGDGVDSWFHPHDDGYYGAFLNTFTFDANGDLVAIYNEFCYGPTDIVFERLTSDFDIAAQTFIDDTTEEAGQFAEAIAALPDGDTVVVGVDDVFAWVRLFDHHGTVLWDDFIEEDAGAGLRSVAVVGDDIVVSGHVGDAGWVRRYHPCDP
jgi:hypothetical protein